MAFEKLIPTPWTNLVSIFAPLIEFVMLSLGAYCFSMMCAESRLISTGIELKTTYLCQGHIGDYDSIQGSGGIFEPLFLVSSGMILVLEVLP